MSHLARFEFLLSMHLISVSSQFVFYFTYKVTNIASHFNCGTEKNEQSQAIFRVYWKHLEDGAFLHNLDNVDLQFVFS